MTDRRELILARLPALLAAVNGVDGTQRNKLPLDDTMGTIVSILDGDETTDPSDGSMGRPSRAPRRVTMLPHLQIVMRGEPETIGTSLNTLRCALYAALLADSTLQGFLGSNGLIRYEGCSTLVDRGVDAIGTMTLLVALSYFLNPAEL